ncbi:hypothetical protein [Sulfurimonas sp.]
MTLQYVGPKPIISHTGIEFDNNKEDKYAYLNIVVQLLKALNHDYFDDKTYTYNVENNRLSDDELLRELRKYCPNLESLIEQKNHDVEDEIEHNIKRAKESYTLSDEEKKTLQNNINIMHDYLIQRSINKSVYYCAIGYLANLLKKDHISYVVAPMFQSFAHVLHSVQGVLLKDKAPIDTKLDIYQEDGKLLVKLQVLNN